jgi:hypothetical protein
MKTYLKLLFLKLKLRLIGLRSRIIRTVLNEYALNVWSRDYIYLDGDCINCYYLPDTNTLDDDGDIAHKLVAYEPNCKQTIEIIEKYCKNNNIIYDGILEIFQYGNFNGKTNITATVIKTFLKYVDDICHEVIK